MNDQDFNTLIQWLRYIDTSITRTNEILLQIKQQEKEYWETWKLKNRRNKK